MVRITVPAALFFAFQKRQIKKAMGVEPEGYGLVLSQDGAKYVSAEEAGEGMVM